MRSSASLAITTVFPPNEMADRFPFAGVGYLMGYVEKHLPQVKCHYLYDDILAGIEALRPDLVGVSATSTAWPQCQELAEQIRQIAPQSIIILGGPHVTTFPQSLAGSPFDLGVIGEGEETLREIVECYLGSPDRPGFLEKCRRIPGVACPQGPNIFFSQSRPFIADLDSIPRPDYSRLTRPGTLQEDLIITSRGCPYGCAFCASSLIWKRRLRFHSPEYVVAEIISRYELEGQATFIPKDDLFAVNSERLEAIAALLKRRGLGGKISFDAVKARPNLVNDDLCRVLKRLGVGSLSMGFESGSARIIKLIKDGPASLEIYQQAIGSCQKQGIDVLGTFIIGNPTETEEDIQETYNFIIKNDIKSPAIFIASPYPGTRFWEMAEERGLIGPDFPWEGLTQHRVFFTDHLSETKILDWAKRFQEIREQRILT